MAEMESEYVSLRPSDAVHGGGMVPEGDYEITEARFGAWDYAGTRPVPVPALSVVFANENQSYTQWYSAGDGKNFVHTEDGKRLKKTGSAGSLNDQSNCFQFLASLVNAGFSEDKLGSDITVIVGCKIQLMHQATQERDIKGVTKKASTLAVIGKIYAYPWDKDAKPKKSAAKAPPKQTASAPNGNEAALRPRALDLLCSALRDAPNRSIDRKTLPSAVFKKIPPTDADRGELMNLVVREDFLNSLLDSGVLYDPEQGVVIYAGD